jgi:hypothetical protein
MDEARKLAQWLHKRVAINCSLEFLAEAIAEGLPTIERMAQPDIAKAIHYPECWCDTAYPTLEDALHELAHWFRCQQEHAAPPAASEDAARLDFLLANMPSIYLGRPYHVMLPENSRAAIDKARGAK